jgi:hypothetical protein
VDVTGIEPVTPCLQSKQGTTMWWILLTFTYVINHHSSNKIIVLGPADLPELARVTGQAMTLHEIRPAGSGEAILRVSARQESFWKHWSWLVESSGFRGIPTSCTGCSGGNRRNCQRAWTGARVNQGNVGHRLEAGL